MIEHCSKAAGGVPSRLAVSAALLALLLPLAQAGWADVALTVPGEAQLLPLDAYKPITWTPEQVEVMRRRALLQQQAEGGGGGGAASTSSSPPRLPVCELNLGYRVVDLTAANFSSIVTLTNNREVSFP